MRTEDYGKTVAEVSPPTFKEPDGKIVPGAFIGLSRRLNDKVYWLNTTGVYTSADKGKTWTIVGQQFPPEWIQKRVVRSGPLFGKDPNQLLVLCLTHVAESLDGGKSWHVLAELPTQLNDSPWAYSFAYDPPRRRLGIAIIGVTAEDRSCSAGWRSSDGETSRRTRRRRRLTLWRRHFPPATA